MVYKGVASTPSYDLYLKFCPCSLVPVEKSTAPSNYPIIAPTKVPTSRSSNLICDGLSMPVRTPEGVSNTTYFECNGQSYCCADVCFQENAADCGNGLFCDYHTGYYTIYVQLSSHSPSTKPALPPSNNPIIAPTMAPAEPTAIPTLVPTYVKPSLLPTKATRPTRHPYGQALVQAYVTSQ